jgi:hypothetical protein
MRKTLEEEAKAFAHYLRDKKWGDVTRLATKIGKTKMYVYRRLRLLNITEESLTNEKTRTDCPTLAEKKTTITHNTSSTHRLEIGRIHDPKTQKRIMKEIANAVGNLKFKDTQSLSNVFIQLVWACHSYILALYPSALVRNFSSTFRVCSGYFL